MPAYVPEFVYGPTDQYCTTFGLVPWPDHLKPRETSTVVDTSSGVELTKKGEAYAEAALAEAGGVFFLTIDSRDRASIATTVERLINMLDDLEPDCDLEPDEGAEPWLGWPDRGPQQLDRNVPLDDREADCEDEGAQCDDEGVQESGIADQDALDLCGFLHVEPLRFDGKGQQEAKDMLRRHRDKTRPPRSPHANVRPLTAEDFGRLPWA